VTEEVIKAAAANAQSGAQIIEMFCSRR
jgi:hypothetical protein